MKWLKLFISLQIFLLPVFSQEQKKINYGVKTGISISGLWGNRVDDFEEELSEQVSDFDADQLISLSGGLFANYQIIPSFLTIQGELLYTRLGKKWQFDTESRDNISLKIYTDYISFPVLFKMLIPLNYPVLPSVYIGPSFYIQLMSRAKNIASIPSTVQQEFFRDFGVEENISEKVSNFDFGFSTGLNFNFIIGTGSILLDFRFNFGALNTFNASGAEDIRNSFFSIMAGYEFEL